MFEKHKIQQLQMDRVCFHSANMAQYTQTKGHEEKYKINTLAQVLKKDEIKNIQNHHNT